MENSRIYLRHAEPTFVLAGRFYRHFQAERACASRPRGGQHFIPQRRSDERVCLPFGCVSLLTLSRWKKLRKARQAIGAPSH